MAVKKRKKQSLLDRMEKKFGKYAINDLIKYMLMIYLLGIVISFVSSITKIDIYNSFLSLDLDKILKGQVWRLFTFVLSSNFNMGGMGMIFTLFMTMIMIAFYFYMGNSLEAEWGAFRFNVYVISGVLAIMISSLATQAIFKALTGVDLGGELYKATGETEVSCIGLMILLAFATIHADEKILLYFIIPIKIKWLAIIMLAYKGYIIGAQGYKGIQALMEGDVVTAEAAIVLIVMMVFSLINFIVFFINFKNKNRTFNKMRKRNSKMKKFSVVNGGNKNIHKCSVCGKTEKDDESLEFRFCSRCEGNHEYCMEHLFTHEHIKKIVIDLNNSDKTKTDKTKDE